MKQIFKKQVVIFGSLIFLSSCAPPSPDSPTSGQSFKNAFDCPADRGWVVLKRPNNVWALGTVLQVSNSGAEDLGNINDLKCFPTEAWIKGEGQAAETKFTGVGNYGMSLSAVLGMPKAELIKLGIKVGADVDGVAKPQHSVIFDAKAMKEERLSYLTLEGYIADNYQTMSANCKRAFETSNRYLVDGTLRVEKGSFKVESNRGVKVDLSTPQYIKIKDAAISAGYTVSDSGSIEFSGNKPPMNVCVRARRFDDVLKSIGAISKGVKEVSFSDQMKKADGIAIP